jgi:hypothetical protein
MAAGTDGNLISYDASGDPVAVATGTDGQVLTSAGAGLPPVFEDANAGDITSVVAGTNLSGGATSGAATLNVDDAFLVNDASDTTSGTITAGGFTTTGNWTFDEADSGTVAIATIQDSGSAFDDSNTQLMTAAAIADKIEGYGYSTASGDITGVTIITDTGILSAMSDTGGSADFSILGSSGVGVTNSGNVATVVAVPGEIGITALSGYTAAAYANISSVGGGSIVTTGALDSGSITSGFGAIDNGSSSITTTGTIYAGNMQISGTLQHTNTEQLNVEDSTILLNSGYSGSSAIDAGIFVERDTTAAVGYVSAERNPALYWDESVGFWGLGQDTDTGTDVTPNGYIAMATSSTSADNGTASPIGSIHIDTDGPDIWIRTA